ncbi:uncharacterized protein PFL1_02791 [Pseudozyma flocculosa PF-1]|uniref:Transcription elongation factor Eaf N-terminal domain-containing protein n=1 Tax=Pseudozyma flocculosa PF-1 TaxID=1277687 RepID=A0A061H9M4_9BASI|nr:uncharacterized protein PFL1_02791 [Pseudozyma flocculosa PF-1]EPQ29572.1 hypothetical protein PFL1_02791 [Pseudozyma flocculosa PF-1]
MQPIAIGESLGGLLRQIASNNTSPLNEPAPHLPSLFSLRYNFKPESVADSTRGILHHPSRNPASDWQLELDAASSTSASAPATAPSSQSQDSATSNSRAAHVFTGSQHAAKGLDCVLVWDAERKTYVLDRIASTFNLKLERSRTSLSDPAFDALSGTGPSRKQKRRRTDMQQAEGIASAFSRAHDRKAESAVQRASSRLSSVTRSAVTPSSSSRDASPMSSASRGRTSLGQSTRLTAALPRRSGNGSTASRMPVGIEVEEPVSKVKSRGLDRHSAEARQAAEADESRRGRRIQPDAAEPAETSQTEPQARSGLLRQDSTDARHPATREGQQHNGRLPSPTPAIEDVGLAVDETVPGKEEEAADLDDEDDLAHALELELGNLSEDEPQRSPTSTSSPQPQPPSATSRKEILDTSIDKAANRFTPEAIAASTTASPNVARFRLKRNPVSRGVSEDSLQAGGSTPLPVTPALHTPSGDLTASPAFSSRSRGGHSVAPLDGATFARSDIDSPMGLGLQTLGHAATPAGSPRIAEVRDAAAARASTPPPTTAQTLEEPIAVDWKPKHADDARGASASYGAGHEDSVDDEDEDDEDEEEGAEEEDDDDDDGLDDFAAELDLTLADNDAGAPPSDEAVPVEEAPAATDTATSARRASRVAPTGTTRQPLRLAAPASSDRSGGRRKVYGLGGPREEEDDLEDSD